MTEEVEAAAPAAPVGVKEHSCGDDDGHTTYPAALASQEAVCEDGELFTRLLQDLNAKLQTAQPKKYRPSKYRVPTVAGKDLSLHALYQQVTGLGGVIAVTADNKWPEIIASFSFQSKVNLSAIKRIYSSLLWHFEQVYQHGMGGQKLQEPPELPAGAVDPALQDGAAAGAIASASRPARNRRGTSLAAIIAATDGADSDDGDAGDAPASGAATDGKKAGDGAAAGANGKAAADGKTPPPAAAAAGKEGGKPPQQQQRSRGPSQQRGGAGAAAAPAKAPDLVGFMKAGRARKDLTGQAVTGRVDARFDCGYFVSLNIAGQSFSGILYCPTAVAAAAAAGASGQAAGRAAAAVKREDSGAAADGSGGGRKAANGSSVGVKRDAAAAAGGDAGEPAQRGGKRRRGPAPSADPGSASKPKSAKTAFNFFAAEQWPLVKAELGPNAVPQEISRAVGERWNKTTDVERQPYMQRSNEDKERFEKAMAGWRQGLESPAGKEAAAAAGGDAAASPVPAAAAAAGGEAAGTPAAADAMEVDGEAAAGQQQQHQTKHKLKLKLGQHGVMGPPSKGAPASPSPVAAVAAAAATPEQHTQEPAAAAPAAAAEPEVKAPAAMPAAAEAAAEAAAAQPTAAAVLEQDAAAVPAVVSAAADDVAPQPMQQ